MRSRGAGIWGNRGSIAGEGVGQQLAHRAAGGGGDRSRTRANTIRCARRTTGSCSCLALGVTPDHVGVSAEVLGRRYLAGDLAAIAEEHRLALGQYVGMVGQLVEATCALRPAGHVEFLSLLQDRSAERSQVGGRGHARSQSPGRLCGAPAMRAGRRGAGARE